jgi:hypothetical protein
MPRFARLFLFSEKDKIVLESANEKENPIYTLRDECSIQLFHVPLLTQCC